MENRILREAFAEDIPRLVELRLRYLRADRGTLTGEEEAALRQVLPEYLNRNLGRTCFVYLVERNGEAVSTAWLAISEKPANPAFITGKIGTVLNVYTDPAHRRKGYASMAIRKLIEKAKEQNCSRIELSATADGRPVYEKLGFTVKESHYTEMLIRLK